jgi:hypothetical protein
MEQPAKWDGNKRVRTRLGNNWEMGRAIRGFAKQTHDEIGGSRARTWGTDPLREELRRLDEVKIRMTHTISLRLI